MWTVFTLPSAILVFSPTTTYGVLLRAKNVLFTYRYMLTDKNTVQPLLFCKQSHICAKMDSIEVVAKHDEDRSAIEAADDQVVVSKSIIFHEKVLTWNRKIWDISQYKHLVNTKGPSENNSL